MELKPKCLVPDCPYPATARGLCSSHYSTAQGFVRRGETTWEQLEKTGKCNTKGILNRGRKNREFFLGNAQPTEQK